MTTVTTQAPPYRPAPAATPLPRARRRRHYGAGRAVAMAPAVAGGSLLMLVLTAGLGMWAGPALLLWLSGAGLVCTRRGERLVVRAAYRFRRPDTRQRQLLEPIWQATLARCELAGDRLDLYVQPGLQPNACAAGRRSVALTEGAVESFLAGRVSGRQMQALLAHELGHHATCATRYGLATGWLAAPGRLAFRAVLGIAGMLAGRRRIGVATGLLVAVGGTIATVQAVQQQQWVAAVMLVGVACALVVTPLVDGAVSRASEHAADQYAADAGLGDDLASALHVLQGHLAPRSWAQRRVDRHPSLDSRARRLAPRQQRIPGQPRVAWSCELFFDRSNESGR